MTTPTLPESPLGHPATPASLLSVNVNGLGGAAKRRALFLSADVHGHDALVLLETHCPSDVAASAWLREGAGPGKPWLGGAYWSHGSSRSCGVGILLHKDFVPQGARVEYSDQAGRILRVGWSRGGARPMAIIAVYAPVEPGPRVAFFSAGGPLQEALAAGRGAEADVLMAGDFNCVMAHTDAEGGAGATGGRGHGADELRALLLANGLTDVWAAVVQRPGRPLLDDRFTHLARCAAGVTAARLDYIMAPAALVAGGWASACRHRWDVAPSDHAAVDLRWQSPLETPRGRWRWRFPDALLRDPGIVDDVLRDLAAYVAAWAPGEPAAEAAPAPRVGRTSRSGCGCGP